MTDNYTYENLTLTSRFASSSKNNELVYTLPFPIQLKNADIAMSSLSVPYSWPNVLTNQYLTYQIGGTLYNILFPSNSLMLISDINAYIQLTMKNNGHYLLDANGVEYYFIELDSNYVYYSTTLTIRPIPSSLTGSFAGFTNPGGCPLTGFCPQLIFNATSSNLYTILGFQNFAGLSVPATATQTTTYQVNSPSVPQAHPVTAVNVSTNIVNSSQFNFTPNSIYTFSPNTTFGSIISINPNPLLWYKAIDNQFNQVRITLTDQDNKDLTVLDPNIIINLYIRSKK